MKKEGRDREDRDREGKEVEKWTKGSGKGVGGVERAGQESPTTSDSRS